MLRDFGASGQRWLSGGLRLRDTGRYQSSSTVTVPEPTLRGAAFLEEKLREYPIPPGIPAVELV